MDGKPVSCFVCFRYCLPNSSKLSRTPVHNNAAALEGTVRSKQKAYTTPPPFYNPNPELCATLPLFIPISSDHQSSTTKAPDLVPCRFGHLWTLDDGKAPR